MKLVFLTLLGIFILTPCFSQPFTSHKVGYGLSYGFPSGGFVHSIMVESELWRNNNTSVWLGIGYTHAGPYPVVSYSTQPSSAVEVRDPGLLRWGTLGLMIQQDLFSLKKATVWVAAGAMVGYGVNGDINIDRTATAPNTDLISISVQNTHPRLMPVVPLRLGTRIKLKKNALDFGFFSYFLGNENYHVGMSTAFIFSTLK